MADSADATPARRPTNGRGIGTLIADVLYILVLAAAAIAWLVFIAGVFWSVAKGLLG